MKKTIAQWLDVQRGLGLIDASIPVAPSFRLGRLKRILASELSTVEEKRVELVKKHGAEKDGTFAVLPEKLEAFKGDYLILVAQEIEIDFVNPVTLNDLGDAKVNPDVFALCDGIFVDQ